MFNQILNLTDIKQYLTDTEKSILKTTLVKYTR